MKKKKIVVTFGFFMVLVCIFCSFSVYQIWKKQCWLWTCAPERTFSVLDLKIPFHRLPDTAIVNPMHTLSERSGVESGIMSFYWQESGNLYGGGLTADKYGTETRAREMFENGLYWRSRGSYETHPEITYESSFADEFVVGCGTSMFDNGYECSFEGRYQEFVVGFGSSIGKQMSESQFEQIVIDIDQQMLNFLAEQ